MSLEQSTYFITASLCLNTQTTFIIPFHCIYTPAWAHVRNGSRITDGSMLMYTGMYTGLTQERHTRWIDGTQLLFVLLVVVGNQLIALLQYL